MAEFLLELLSEDIPARMQARAAEDLKRRLTERLTAGGLTFGQARALVTPRRLTLVVDGLPARTADVAEERKGPRVGAPDPAVQGFLKAAGLASLDQCQQRDTGKGVFWFAVSHKPGRPTPELLSEAIPAVLAALPWPKSMRWATGAFRWVRPLHAILALFDGRPLAGQFAPGGALPPLVFADTTRGHRFLAPESFSVTGFADYRARLEQAFVLLDREARKAKIAAEAARLAAAEGLTVAPDEGLLDEVAGLVEWPVVLIGTIDRQFMDVPAEILITSMRTHQKYFATLTADGALAPRFIVVANNVTTDGGLAVVAGNQRVLRARLSDAKFFWDHDRKLTLASRVPALKDIIFHARLGTVADKVARIEALAGAIARVIGADAAQAARAAHLAKADLVAGVVGEFPELQGVMGRYYALNDGEPAAVAEAVAEHYKPLGPGDRCPTAPVSVAVALADKLDTLVGFFAIDEKPTGSKDPYALRRAALGVIRLIVDNQLRLGLEAVFARAHQAQTATGLAAAETVSGELLAFFADRLKVGLKEQGVRHDLIDAVFALGGEDDLVRLLARVSALQSFLSSEDGANLLVAYRRAANILRIEEKKDGVAYTQAPDPALLALAEEQALAQALAGLHDQAAALLAKEDFTGTMAALAALRAPVDAFFDQVTVNAEPPAVRANRLRLLARIRATLDQIADFSRIEG